MSIKTPKISIVYLVLATLLVVGLFPVLLTGWLLSSRSEQELRAVEGRYQAQLVQDKARQMEMFGQRYRDVVAELARAFELAGGVEVLNREGTEEHLRRTLKEDPNLLALSIRPLSGEPFTAYRTETITETEIDKFSETILGTLGEKGLIIGKPQILPEKQLIVLPIAAPILRGGKGSQVVAAVVGVISLQDVTKVFQNESGKTEEELLNGGLPVLFVVDENGKTIIHPEWKAVAEGRSQTKLKIVQDWMEMGSQLQAGLAPFTIEEDGKQTKMLGAYSTAKLSPDAQFGVIAIQDEQAALLSVAEMRQSIWLISIAAAVLAVILGFVLAQMMTKPLLVIVKAAQAIAAGDFSNRIRITGHTEIGTLGEAFNTMTDKVEIYIADLQRAAEENKQLFLGTVKSLATAIDGKDPYTRGHSERVARISLAIGQRLNLPEDEMEKLRISALLHDVGKIGIDDAILKKPAALTDEEYEQMKQHPQKGYKIMAQIPGMKDFLPGMYMHHEMIDGNGYPQGLKGNEIPMQARIVSVADTFDAMTTDRPYSKAMTVEQAVERIQTFIGTRYDVRVVKALAAACLEGQIRAGSVKLKNHPAKSPTPSSTQTLN